MKHIWLLADESRLEAAERQIRDGCAALGCFPEVRPFPRPEALYAAMAGADPDCVVTALPGVAGLNAAEYLRRLCPGCGLVWASDLDFSLQAYRLRADHFILGEPEGDALTEGLSRCMERLGCQQQISN